MPPVYSPRTPPYKHQREALNKGWKRRGFAYLMDMGTGKTRTLIDNVCLLQQNEGLTGLLIVAPKSVYTNWMRRSDTKPGELQKWLWEGIEETVRTYTWVSGKSNNEAGKHAAILDTTQPGLCVLAVNAEALSRSDICAFLCERFLRTHKTLMVVDESTLMQDPRSLRTKELRRLRDFAAWRRILTGSPSKGLPTDLYAQFDFLDTGLLGHKSFYTFRAAYCKMRDIVVNGRVIKQITGVQNIEQLAKEIEKHSFRCRKDECLDLPPKVYDRRTVEITKEQHRMYEQLRKTALTELGGEALTTQLVITQVMRMHQVLCGHAKLDNGEVVRIPSNRLAVLEELIEQTDEQAIIWCGFRDDADLVAERLRELYGAGSVSEWHGGINQAGRDAGEIEFQEGRARFMVATRAGARGRTWTAASLVVYYSNDYDLEIREQSEDRAHRIGQTKTVVYYDLVIPNTIDEKIIDALRSKKDIVRGILSDGPTDWI